MKQFPDIVINVIQYNGVQLVFIPIYIPCLFWASIHLSVKTSYRKISWSLEVARFRFRFFPPIALKINRHLGSSAAEMPVKIQSDTIIITPIPATSRLREVWRQNVLVNRGPGMLMVHVSIMKSKKYHKGIDVNSTVNHLV